MSDSEDEAALKDGEKIDKEQLRKIEDNDRKVDKKEKRRKRLENQGIKEEQSGSEFDDESEGEASGEEKKNEPKEVEHKPLVKKAEEIKKSLFLGEKYGHYKIGTYMRIEVKIDKKVSRQLEPDFPITLCSLKHQELGFAFLRVKIKKHRWYPHVLKTKDPITFSVGWRKF
jgi:ribosome biogenesis protein BMS1